MPKLDGTGFDSPKGKNGLEAFEDAETPGAGKGAGAGDGGTGPKMAEHGSRTTDIGGSKK